MHHESHESHELFFTMTMNYEPFSVVNGQRSTDKQGRHSERNPL